MNQGRIYAVLAILGIVIPYYFLIGFLMRNGFRISLLTDRLFATSSSTFLVIDIILIAVVVLIFIISEGTKQKVPYLWVPVLGMFIAGPSFSLPCFLYLWKE